MFSFHRKKPHEISHGIGSYPSSSSTPASSYPSHSMASPPNTRTDKLTAANMALSPSGNYDNTSNIGGGLHNNSHLSTVPMQHDSSFNSTLKKGSSYRQQGILDSSNRTLTSTNNSFADQEYDTQQTLQPTSYNTHSHSNSNPLPQQPSILHSSTPNQNLNQYMRPSSAQQQKTRRVWVRKNFHTATTITVGPYDIVDDLKYMIANKFPTTLALQVDPSDLVIRMIVSGDSNQNTTSGVNSSSANNLSSMNTFHPVPRKPIVEESNSPISNSFFRSQHPPTIGQSFRPNTPGSPDTTSNHKADSDTNLPLHKTISKSLTLEPDVLVWSVLDRYFPQGMSMNDAFIIESSNKGITPVDDSIRGHQRQRTTALQNSQMRGIRNSLDASENGLVEMRQQNMTSLPTGKIAILGDQKVPPPRLKKSISAENQNNAASQPSAVILFSKDMRDSSKSPLTGNGNDTSSQPVASSSKVEGEKNTAVKMSKFLPSRSSSSESHKKLGLKVNTDPASDARGTQTKLELEQPVASTPASGQTAFTSTPSSDLTLTPKIAESTTEAKPVKKPIKKSSEKNKGKQGISKILNHINVLVVEDNLVNQKIMARHLKSCKVQFQIASTGQEALEIWKKGGFHLCFMDIQLPVMSGIEVTKEIRRLERLNHIGNISNHSKSKSNEIMLNEEDSLDLSMFRSPIIIVALTASTGASDQQDALAAGCNDYLTKPVQLKWLKNKLTEWGYMQALINYDLFRSEDNE